ncbi:hypothetical protein [Novipirellula aureliae]|nr:hypothetical protein [Novipirellula aureliae]
MHFATQQAKPGNNSQSFSMFPNAADVRVCGPEKDVGMVCRLLATSRNSG